MKKNKVLNLMILSALSATLFVGCGNKNDGATNPPSTNPTATPASGSTPEPGAPVVDDSYVFEGKGKDYSGMTITARAYRDMWEAGYGSAADETGSDSEWRMMYQAIQGFMADYPGSKVITSPTSHGGEDLVAAINSGDQWDLQMIIIPSGEVFESGKYQPISKFYDHSNPIFTPEAMAWTNWKGVQYGVSNIWMSDAEWGVYNQTWFTELGIKSPGDYMKEGKWNWQAMEELIFDLNNQDTTAVTYLINFNSNRPSFYATNGVKWDTDKGTVEVTFDSAENMERLEFLRYLGFDLGIKNGRYNSVVDRTRILSTEIFPAIFLKSTNQQRKLIAGGTDPAALDDVGYFPWPTKDGSYSSYLVDYSWAVPKGVKEEQAFAAVELATRFLQLKEDYFLSFYAEYMEDFEFEAMKESVYNGYVLRGVPGVSDTVWSNTTLNDAITSGKAMSTYVSEVIGAIKQGAEIWNNEKGIK